MLATPLIVHSIRSREIELWRFDNQRVLGTGIVPSRGSLPGGGMTRISDDSLGLNGYASHAGLGTFGPNTVTFNLIRMTNGVISGGSSDTSDTSAINMDSSNLHLEMESIGDFIIASYWRVMEGGGIHSRQPCRSRIPCSQMEALDCSVLLTDRRKASFSTISKLFRYRNQSPCCY